MKIYVQKDTIGVFEFEELPDVSFLRGDTYQDYLDGKWVELSEEQNDFRLANPTASVREILAMELDPVVEPPEPPEPPDEKYTWQEKQDFIEGLIEGLGI